MEITRESLLGLTTAYRGEFNKGFGSIAPEWKKLATYVPSTSAANIYPFLGKFFKLREWIGDREIQDLSASSYQIDNKKFEGTVGVERNFIEDDQYGIFAPLMEQMGTETANFPDTSMFDLLGVGQTALCYDKLPFFSAEHKANKKTVSNLITGSASPCYLLDAKKPLKPLIFQDRKPFKFVSLTNEKDENVFYRDKYVYGVDGRAAAGYGFWQQAYCIADELNEETFNTAYNTMGALRDDSGSPLGIKPTVLVCGMSNRVAAHDTVLSDKRANQTNNPNYKIVDVIISPFLP